MWVWWGLPWFPSGLALQEAVGSIACVHVWSDFQHLGSIALIHERGNTGKGFKDWVRCGFPPRPQGGFLRSSIDAMYIVACMSCAYCNGCFLSQGGSAWQSNPFKAAMAKHISFAVHRQAYETGCFLSYLVDIRGDTDETIAFFCAVRYIDRLSKKILSRKARVDRDTALAVARNNSLEAALAPDSVPSDKAIHSNSEITKKVEVRVVNALSGEEHCRMAMSVWCLLGDAVTKANCMHKEDLKKSGHASFMPDVDEYTPVDKDRCRQHIHKLLTPGQKVVEIQVLKGMAEPKKPSER